MALIFHCAPKTMLNCLRMLTVIWASIGSISTAHTTENSQAVQIVGFGDSLMAGYELGINEGFTTVLQAALKAKGFDALVTNAGVSGDTSTGGLERLDWSVPEGTQLVILELGGNDALRGIAPSLTRENIEKMILRLKERKIAIVLAGILAPPNMGADYEAAFNPIFTQLAAKHSVPLIPFFLEGVAGKAELQLADRLHPNAKGVEVMVANALQTILTEVGRLSSPK